MCAKFKEPEILNNYLYFVVVVWSWQTKSFLLWTLKVVFNFLIYCHRHFPACYLYLFSTKSLQLCSNGWILCLIKLVVFGISTLKSFYFLFGTFVHRGHISNLSTPVNLWLEGLKEEVWDLYINIHIMLVEY